MPKLKTHSGCKKRFRVKPNGKVKRGHAFKRHNLNRRTQDMKRTARGMSLVNERDAHHILQKMPYN